MDIPIDELLNCTVLTEKILTKWPSRNRNIFEIMNDEDVAFKMLRSNETLLEQELNELRSKRNKFICLNDNLEHGTNATQGAHLRAMLQQFFTSMLPVRSQFELPPGEHNRFLYIDRYIIWQRELSHKSSLYYSCSYLFIIINVILFIQMLIQ